MIFTNELDRENTRKTENSIPSSYSIDSHNEDDEFQVTAEMLVSEQDHEGTLDEEEAFDDVDHAAEMAELQKESELPIEDILALYFNETNDLESQKENMPNSGTGTPATKSAGESKNEGKLTLGDGIREGMPMMPTQDGVNHMPMGELVSTENGYNDYDPFFNQRITRGLAALNSQYFEEDYSTDEEYQPTIDDWKKEVQIGSEYQAKVPEGLSPYKPGENVSSGDKLLWKPDIVSPLQLKRFLNIAYKLTEFNSQTTDRDDEQILYTLLQSRDVEKALKRRIEQNNHRPDVNLWSEEECQNFEQGLRVFGKDFRLIQRNKIKCRSIGEIVQFYYLWKKTERHDAFVMQTKYGRKKYTLPGIADMMGRFMEEDENIFANHDTSPKKITEDNSNSIYSEKNEQYFGNDFNFNKENANNSRWIGSPVSAVSSN